MTDNNEEWISVSVKNKLPEYKDVLVTDGTHVWIGTYRWHSEDEGSWAVYMTAPFRSNNVTHWMPLPEPPTK